MLGDNEPFIFEVVDEGIEAQINCLPSPIHPLHY